MMVDIVMARNLLAVSEETLVGFTGASHGEASDDEVIILEDSDEGGRGMQEHVLEIDDSTEGEGQMNDEVQIVSTSLVSHGLHPHPGCANTGQRR